MKLQRFLARMPIQLFNALRQHAGAQEESINSALVQLLEKALQTEALSIKVTLAPALARALRSVKQLFGAELLGVVLFGSTARGEDRPGSDVDILLVLNSKRQLNRELYDQVYASLLESDKDKAAPHLSLHLINLPENDTAVDGFLLEVALEGIVLFERDFLVSRFFIKLRKMITVGYFVRETLYGHPYWILPANTRPTDLPKGSMQ